MQSISDCFYRVKLDCLKYIASQETKKFKFKNKKKLIKTFLIPICFWISQKKKNKIPLIIGLSGGQGTGKSTLSKIISIILKKYFKFKVYNISIDDFYKTKKERELLFKTRHPLLITRGVPGTHDINMLSNFLKKIKTKNFKKFKFPSFDKSTDDRKKKNQWHLIKYKPDILIFEGWCIGSKHQNTKNLKKSINETEKFFDKNLKWRKFVNLQLKNKYKKIFNQIDYLMYLKANNFNLLKKWRLKQEKKLLMKNNFTNNLKIMNKKKLSEFMQTYERITKHMLKTTPNYASVVIKLDNNHEIKKIKFNQI
tara:strand:- start:22 stop:951 length:930 start_codon:yes stop_codon:yes gene_type:complete